MVLTELELELAHAPMSANRLSRPPLVDVRFGSIK